MKKCFKCGKEKGLSEFYVHKNMADGHLGKCKECAKKDSTEHRNKNIERIQEYDRQRAKLPHRKKLARKINQRYLRKNPLRKRQNTRLERAVKKGKMIRPNQCELCGKAKHQINGHHPDYSKPLKVMWLCQSCHVKLHKGLI